MDMLDLDFHPLTPERWDDLEQLFGAKGACGGCWCMWWRIPRSLFNRQKGETNRQSLRALVEEGRVPGILAYHEGVPVAWCAVEPREAYPVLNKSRTLKPVDDEPVWSVTCFFVARPYRGHGISVRLLNVATEYVRSRGGTMLEGYPVVPRSGKMPDAFAWTGLAATFEKAGFTECARRSSTRPIMRFHIPS
jgi:GNAT superfamily N-acetyltransferase